MVAFGNTVYAPADKRSGSTAAKIGSLKGIAQRIAANGEQRTKDVLKTLERKM